MGGVVCNRSARAHSQSRAYALAVAARLPLLIFGRSSHEHIDPKNHAGMIFADAYVHG